MLDQLKDNLFTLSLFNCFVNVILFFILSKKTVHRTWSLPILILDSLIPIYFSIAIFIFVILSPLYKKIYKGDEAQSHEDFDDEEFLKYSEYQLAKTQRLSSEGIEDHLHEAFQIQPYIDIIMGEDIDMKLSVCIKISKFRTSKSVIILKVALQDPNYEVRYMANNSLNKIEQYFMNEIDLLSDNIKKFPQNSDLFNLRGNNYLRLYNIGILDQYLANIFLKNALRDYQTVITQNPTEFSIYLKIGYIYMKLSMHRELDLLISKATRLEMSQEDKAKLIFYQIESFYMRKEFSKVVSACKELDLSHIKHPKILVPTNFWRDL